MASSRVNKAENTPPGWTRIAVLGIILFCIGLYIASVFVWFGYAPNHLEEFTIYSWSIEEMSRLLSRIGLSYQAWINIQLVLGLVNAACYCIVGGFIFAKKSNDWFGLYVSVILVLFGTIGTSDVYFLLDQLPWLGYLLQPLSVLTWAFWFILFYLFPDGHFVPRWTRWFAVMLLLGFVIDIIFYGGDSPPAWLIVLLLPGIVMGMISQVYRYRRVSGTVERQQTKWALFAILVLVFSLIIGLLSVLFSELANINSPSALFLFLFSLISSLLILILPLSIGFSILRYHLWDIDVIIRRTLLYGLLTAFLGLVFFGGVTLLQRVFTAITGQQSPVSIVISTLVIVVLSNPLRRFFQNSIDRRFFRKKYDAQKLLEEFAAAAREEVGLEDLSGHLLRVVDETIQPDRITLWMKPVTQGKKNGNAL